MRKFINKGNYELAYNELKNDNNNSVSFLYPYANNDYIPNKFLSNVVLTIKDNYATKESKTKASSKILENFTPYYNATVLNKLYENGALKIAKVHLDELALGGTGTHSAFGIIKNPKNQEYYAGGSSSGSVATFTKNIGIALGSDTGDSVRLPASYNGIVGFKPSYGAISRYGLFAFASSLDTVAYFTHNVNDCILVSQAVFGKDSKDMTSKDIEISNVIKTKPKKIGMWDFSDFCEDYVNQKMDELFKKLNDQGIIIEKIKPNIDILRTIKPVYQVLSFSEASSNLSNLTGVSFGNRVDGSSWEELMLYTRSNNFGKMVQERLSLGSYFLYSNNIEEIFFKAQKVRRLIKNYYTKLHNDYDIIIFPAFGGIAPKFNELKEYGVMDYILTGANLVGNPSITIPLSKYQKMPFSLAIESKIYSDEKLLGYAEYIEEIIGEINE
ncbi:amidase family protein [Mycoplasmopsis felis]|uniref:amidase family protein n=1 Tax=Mycoplasmopsis felis TaxID=33923 RepID=UPI0021AE59D3|nr:amidase family protein [Mycoplasmopsis felis]UWV78609.1 amidase family protein [Mycoplasmopsis felis]WQQ09629.1 amidase family protein [Mycoplasmopsis felis]